jgi:hypothetical protein
VCLLIFPAEACHYCGARAFGSLSLYDGTNRVNRFYCTTCCDALHDENEAMQALIPPAELAAVHAANEIVLAANIAAAENEIGEGNNDEDNNDDVVEGSDDGDE